MKVNCIIIDDEPLARKLIKNHLSHFKQFHVMEECENAIEGSIALQNNPVDLVFVDIQMPGINGIEFLKSLTVKPKIIITSAYKEFAIDGFNLDVLDFLLKPITIERFFKAINKYLETYPNNGSLKTEYKGNYQEILVKDNNKTFRINPNDIFFIEGMGEYIKVITKTENIITKTSLVRFYDQLPKDTFMRVHKSYLINHKKVKSFTSSSVDINGKKIPIGRSYKISTLEVLKA